MLKELDIGCRKKFYSSQPTRFKSIAVYTSEYKRNYNMMLGLPVKVYRGAYPPYGYTKVGGFFCPDESVFQALVKAKHYILQGVGYREAAKWLSLATGCYYSYSKLSRLMRYRPPDDLISQIPYEERLLMRLEE